MAKIVLASGSPRRQELLRLMGITDFDIRVPQAEEGYPAGLSPPAGGRIYLPGKGGGGGQAVRPR